MTEKLIPYDGTRYLDDEEDIALFLDFAAEDAANENDPAILARAIKTIAKARGMTELAKVAGIPSDDLYDLLDAPNMEALHKLLADAGITPTTGEDSGEAPAPKKAPALAEA